MKPLANQIFYDILHHWVLNNLIISEKMSAHSGGATDWNSVVKPLLNNRFGVLNKNEILNIIKAITKW